MSESLIDRRTGTFLGLLFLVIVLVPAGNLLATPGSAAHVPSHIVALLGKVHASLPEGGALLVVEWLLQPGKTAPVSAALQSLNMLICTDGRERTFAEYETLLKSAGFGEVQGQITGNPIDAVLARK